MKAAQERNSNLNRSLNELYDGKLTPEEGESAKRYLLDFFTILNQVHTRSENANKHITKGCKANDNLRSSN